ncbi:MAG: hypothetical protein SVT56_12315 [Chloroflexota bacterium]|nr:hypothetical protein [Chloroflexota bacterium]
MTQQYESLINPEELDKRLLNNEFRGHHLKELHILFEDDTDTLIVLLKDPKKVDTATYYLSDRLACVVNLDNQQVVGFWLLRFSKHWLEINELSDLKKMWGDVVRSGRFSEYRKITRHDKQRHADQRKNGNDESRKLVNDLLQSSELQKELCLA